MKKKQHFLDREYKSLDEWAEDNEFIPIHNGASFIDVDGHVWPRDWVSDYLAYEFDWIVD